MLEKIKAALDEAMTKLENAINTADNDAIRIHAHIIAALHALL